MIDPAASPLRLFLPLWRFGSNVRNAADSQVEGLSEGAVLTEWLFAAIVVFGVVGEFVIAARHPPYDSWLGQWGPAYADLMVASGIAFEVIAGVVSHLCQNDLTRRSADRLKEAVDARAELEKKLWPRMLSQDQWDFIQGLAGKFPIVAIAFETDAETRWFANHIRDAFFSAKISVAMYPRAAEVHSFSTYIFEPKGFDGARARTSQPLVEIFNKAELVGSLAVITEVPTDIVAAIGATRLEMRAPLDTPMIIVGGRFVLPPPHLDRAAKEAKAARDRMAKLKGRLSRT